MKKPLKVEMTRDYNRFKLLPENRPTKPADIRSLIRSIQTKDFLYLFPIIVNSRNQVIEGQHRLAAAKELKIPIYFFVDDVIRPEDIILINNNRKAWSMRNYIHFYATRGKKEYKDVAKLLDEFPGLTIMAAFRLINSSMTGYTGGGGEYRKHILRGDAKGGTVDLAREVCRVAKRYQEAGITYAWSGFFVMDLKNAIIQSGKTADKAAQLLMEKYQAFPKFTDNTPAFLQQMKDILGIKAMRPYSSPEAIKAFLKL